MYPSPREGKRGLSLAVRAAGSLIALAFLVQWLSSLGWQELGEGLASLTPATIIAILLIALASRFSITARWHVLLRSGGARVSFAESLKLTFAGLFASNFLPTTIGGDVIRLAGVLQRGVDGSLGTASLIADRLVGMAGMALALPIGLMEAVGSLRGAAAATPVGAAGWLSLGNLGRRVRVFLEGVLQAMRRWLGHPRALATAYAFTLLHMTFTFLALQVIMRAYGEDMSLLRIAGLWSIVYFITLLPISINGLGVQEVAVSYFFSTIGGLSVETGLSLALLIRAAFMAVSLPGVFELVQILIGRRKADEALRYAGSVRPEKDPSL